MSTPASDPAALTELERRLMAAIAARAAGAPLDPTTEAAVES